MIQAGDLTPAGRVDNVDLDRDLRRIDLTIDGHPYSRSYEDRVDRIRTPADASQDLHDVERTLDDPQLDLDLPSPDDVHEVATRRLARVPNPLPQTSPTTRRSAAPGR